MVAYCASKAFDTVMAEALWAELHGEGVDVLALVLGVTDTPGAAQAARPPRPASPAPDDATPIPGAATADEVVADALANLTNGPTWFVGEPLREGARQLSALPRSEAVRMMIQMSSGGVMGPDRKS